MRAAPLFPLLLAACLSSNADQRAERAGAVPDGDGTVVVREPTVLVFVLPAADTMPAEDTDGLLEEFRYYTARAAEALEAQGLTLRTTNAESITVEMEHGPRRVIMLSGLDYPFGYVLVEPGFAEIILTGVSTDEELLDEAGWYFGLDQEEEESGSVQRARRPHPTPSTSVTLVSRPDGVNGF